MGEPFVGEIRMFAGNFPPSGWAFCNGQTMPISENETLFNLIGTTYGGDGQETFNLPDLQGRVPMHAGTGKDGITYTLGEKAGTESVTLTTQQIPVHNHAFVASQAIAGQANASGNVNAQSASIDWYIEDTPSVNMSANSITSAGGSQPHENLQPYLVIDFILSLFGVFPSQN
jgi:microcystin-dependent protein